MLKSIKLPLLSSMIILCSVRGLSATVVDQIVETTIDNETHRANYQWFIDSDKFRLDISSNKGALSYIFNGKNFYACGKIDQNTLEKMSNFSIKDLALIATIANGSCQAVPLNFMTRFFLSPAGAISTIDYSDGMKLTLSLEKYEFTQTGTGQSLASKCKKIDRNFSLEKNIEDNSKQTQSVKEASCISNSIDWRQSIWKQISRSLIRQPETRSLQRDLKKDLNNVEGMVLDSKETFSKTNKEGKPISGSRKISTKMVKYNSKVASKNYSIPAGFAVIDIHSAQFLPASENKNIKMDQDPIPAFLYHILGGVL